MVSLFTKPLSKESPPKVYAFKPHRQPPVGTTVSDPIQTNNTFNNLLLGDQTCPTWPLPYSVWVNRIGKADHGLAINHTEANQRVFGPSPMSDPAEFYFNPPKINSLTLTAEKWTSVNVITTRNTKLATTLKFIGKQGSMTTPLVHGMGFVTALYEMTLPVIYSAVGFRKFTRHDSKDGNTYKCIAELNNGVTWSIYISGDPKNKLLFMDDNHLEFEQSTRKMVVQVCKGQSPVYDECCGAYPVNITVSANAERASGNNSGFGDYTLKYVNQGKSSSGTTLVWALPHHISMLTDAVAAKFANLTFDSPTKGVMKAYKTNELKMKVPKLPTNIGFRPWTSVKGFSYNSGNYTAEVREKIRKAAAIECQDDVLGQCDLDSMYFAGKQLNKYAYIAFVVHTILRDSDLTAKILPKIKQAIEKFARNAQKNPLVYENSWKGLISSAEPGADFGNSNYNDHHFHYGYHVHAIALVAKVDPGWLKANNNLVYNYALTLIRDYANPSTADPFFPFSRNFDWYHGHSFAHGIFPSGDGKNEESSSEDYHAMYALKLFARITSNNELELSADLILGIMREAINRYMLYKKDNKDEPKRILPNKVSGILFENKIHYATFFGRGTIGDEWINGIHMIPITGISSFIRGESFVKEEWDEKLKGIVDRIPDGWKGILKLNQGLFDPKASWAWFSNDSAFKPELIDPGMSRTWSLAYLGGIGGAK